MITIHKKLLVVFKMSPLSLQTFIDTLNCVHEDRVHYSTVHNQDIQILNMFTSMNHMLPHLGKHTEFFEHSVCLRQEKTCAIIGLRPQATSICTNCMASSMEKLSFPQLVKKSHAFCGTRRFITVFTRARHLLSP
jgi:hypothetical protein